MGEGTSASAQPLWAGRFSEVPEDELARFGASLAFDARLWPQDIEGSIAHATMLAARGIISQEDADAIVAGLRGIADELAAGTLVLDPETGDEDVHMAVERVLTERIGAAGGRLHTGRSRNDQSVLDTRLYAKAAAEQLMAASAELAGVMLARAEESRDVILPGYTHLQPAQPVLLAHHLLAYFWMFRRDYVRLAAARDAADASPLGAAALAGTTYPIDRAATAEALGLSGVIPNSMDAVSDRDFICDLVYACALAQVHLSRLCEELILWCSAEFGFCEMDDAHSTGSSIMPQTKNPDFAELVRGKSGRAIGNLVSILTVLKGLPLTYGKDLQEDKEALFDAVDTLSGSLMAVTGMMRTLSYRADRMAEAACEGYMAATDLADYLVSKGMPFREAHAVVGRVVARCVAEGRTLQDLSVDELAEMDASFDECALAALDITQVVARRNSEGGTGHDAVEEQIRLAREALAEMA